MAVAIVVAPVVSAVTVMPMSSVAWVGLPMVMDTFVVPVAVGVVSVQVSSMLVGGHKASVRKQWMGMDSVIPNNPNRFQPYYAVVFNDCVPEPHPGIEGNRRRLAGTFDRRGVMYGF